ncbi:uncharacterized protein K452DRAFT_297392 [Aplosporella prunicola CBS 121167]|uniref:GPI ethanolamine phosphate transferase 2 n=1 Tax=Aplosporella prunicola CBS 121167 TaxID=1176127 RepID=A0A6A6BFC0_9PEZI|nr:uncharacterized protein K452DRAFT_297392 [Aplosporella prunicola CBS 121167]KAF2142872.1 hypothetical protein K452DRAFT_297392 [Aplosporella prunicola CBS 121167]
MPSQSQKWLLAAANVLIPIAVLTFAVGFFPYKPFIPGLAEYETLESGAPPEAPFDKVVFMVVDALRSDFVFSNSSGFEFTQGLISSGAALPFTAHATSPTITMPRVKAITTGSIPSFLDVILNFAESDSTSTLASQDTWLAQLKAKKDGKLVMYGDDTWLKLFPETFARADGTSSFFVSDFTEVDNNVTRHVPDELQASDWNAMIMHYLGLDHIGHKTGPLGPNMIPKQAEMDGIVKEIYQAIETQKHLKNTLFVLCGDHGMNDGGNHGGSAPGETSPALVFMSPKLKKISKGLPCPTEPKEDFDYYTKIEQSDIAPTLAGLLGFPVPLNNLGVFITDFLPFWSNGNDRAQIMLRNAVQILNIVKATFPDPAFENPFTEVKCDSISSAGNELACKWRKVTTIFHDAGAYRPKPDDIIPPLVDFCRSAQDIMSSTASNYNLALLIAGTSIALLSLGLAFTALRPLKTSVSSAGIFYTALVLLYGIMMFASSYVEEEQHFWYWATSAWFVYLFVNKSRRSHVLTVIGPSLALLALHRLTRRWNQTGQKYAGAPDIVHSAVLTNPVVLWTLVAGTYLWLMLRLRSHISRRMGRQLQTFATGNAVLLCGISFLFKLAFTARDAPELVRGASPGAIEFLEGLSLVRLARVVFIGTIMGAAWLFAQERGPLSGPTSGSRAMVAEGLHDFLTLLLLTQTRAPNIPLFLVFRAQQHFLSRLPPLSPTEISTTTLLLAHASFFALGNSNAISSIDLSNAYNGVASYNVVAVGALIFVGNWAGPVFWGCAGGLRVLEDARWRRNMEVVRRLQEAKRAAAQAAAGKASSSARRGVLLRDPAEGMFFAHFARLTLWTAAALGAVMAACTVLRSHLFIWTVFSPKYLYAMAWGVLYHLVVSGGLGGALWWAGGGVVRR